MKISYNWLQEYIDLKGVSAQKVAELLTLDSFEVTTCTKRGDDWILDVDILPNRGHDCRCHLALAQELAAILNQKVKYNYHNLKTAAWRPAETTGEPLVVMLACSDNSVPRYAALLIKNVKLGLSPQWLKERLEAIGLRSLNNLVDLTNYIMYEVGQPMHAFDYDKIRNFCRNDRRNGRKSVQGVQMIVRLSKLGEKVITLDGTERKLPQGVLVIEAGNKLIDLVGIMGGQLSEIGPETKNIVLQAACFDGAIIRRATKLLNHRTDASDIYQHNIDPNLADVALARAWYLLKELAGGQVVQKIDIYPNKRISPEIVLDLVKTRTLLGVNLAEKKIIQILKSLDFGVETDCKLSLRKGTLLVKAPTRRLDINIPEDVIEEIGRIYGYQKIKPIMPRVHLQPPEPNEAVIYKQQMRQILVGLGFDEVMNYIFVGAIHESPLRERLVALQNPISRKRTHLRIDLLPGLAQNLKDNLKNFSEMQLFEIGHVFSPPLNKGGLELTPNLSRGGVIEKENLAGIILLPEKQPFFRLKGIIDTFLQHLGLSDIWYDDYFPKSEVRGLAGGLFNEAALAQIKIGEKIVGHLGELKEQFTGQVAAGFEFDLAGLIQEITEERMYQPASKYPAAVRDLAILVPSETRVADVLNIINTVDIPKLFDVDLFDMYEGEGLAGRKNLAFHLIFQSPERTLSDREVDKMMTQLMQAIEKQPGWQVRR